MNKSTKQSIRLSVIVPGYNTPKQWWQRCISSIIRAVGENDEIICVDDGSDVPVSKDWFPSYSGLRLLRHEKNEGLSSARNSALRICGGKYVAFVDSDDEVMPWTYERGVAALEKYCSDISILGVRVVWFNAGLMKDDVLPEINFGKFDGEGLAKVYKACLFDYAWNKIYRHGFIERAHLVFDEDVMTGEDTVFNCQAVVAGARWCTVGCIGNVYYRYDGTMLSRFVSNIRYTHKKKLESRIACRNECQGSDALLGGTIKLDEDVLDNAEWSNMWQRASPISIKDRWQYLIDHKSMVNGLLVIEFLKKYIYMILRAKLYFPFIQKWHIKRLYPNVVEIKK